MSAAEDFVFGLIERAAIADARCPQNDEIVHAMALAGIRRLRGETPSRIIGALARAGHIRGGVYGKNWRTLWIATGPHAGKHTKKCHESRRPHVIFDRFGASRARSRA